jgi:putative endonuclease
MDHELGASAKAYTYNRRPFQALYWEIHDSPMDRILHEKQLMEWTRAKKRALIEGNISELKRLSASSLRQAQDDPTEDSGIFDFY